MLRGCCHAANTNNRRSITFNKTKCRFTKKILALKAENYLNRLKVFENKYNNE